MQEKVERFYISLEKVGLGGSHLSADNILISKGDCILPPHFTGFLGYKSSFSFNLNTYDLVFDFLVDGVAYFHLVIKSWLWVQQFFIF